MAVVSSAEAGLRAASRATVLQLRAPDVTTRLLEVEAAALVAGTNLPVLVSSRCDVALATGAAGVNLPERDIGIELARGLIRHGLIGRSVHSLEAGRRAQDEGADFVIFGPVWATPSHPAAEPAGIDELGHVAHALRIPVIAIGGVTEGRVSECLAAGAGGYAAITLFS